MGLSRAVTELSYKVYEHYDAHSFLYFLIWLGCMIYATGIFTGIVLTKFTEFLAVRLS